MCATVRFIRDVSPLFKSSVSHGSTVDGPMGRTLGALRVPLLGPMIRIFCLRGCSWLEFAQSSERAAPAQMNGIIAVRPSARSWAIFADTVMVCSAAARMVTAARCLIAGFRLPCEQVFNRALQRLDIATPHVQAISNT